MPIIRTQAKGQIVIPAEMRRKYNIKPGTKIQIMEYGDIIYLIPQLSNPVKAAQGFLPSKPSLANLLLRSRTKQSS